MSLPVGKLPVHLLERLLRRLPVNDHRLLLGPGIGRDAAVISLGGACLIAKTDPITFATDEIGWYAVHVNANDIACMGGQPKWFLACVLLPQDSATEELASHIHNSILDACAELNVSLAGGHTEITWGLDRPIVIGQMLGEAPSAKVVTGASLAPGARLLLAKGIAIEGTSIIARERGQSLAGLAAPDLLRRAAGFLRQPGLSVVAQAMAAVAGPGVLAMHDPTEGGLASGAWEMARRAGLGLRVRLDRICVYEETRVLAQALNLDPLGLIASGALLIAAQPDHSDNIRRRVEATGVPCADIGELRPAAEGFTMETSDGPRPWPSFERDEIARLFSS